MASVADIPRRKCIGEVIQSATALFTSLVIVVTSGSLTSFAFSPLINARIDVTDFYLNLHRPGGPETHILLFIIILVQGF